MVESKKNIMKKLQILTFFLAIVLYSCSNDDEDMANAPSYPVNDPSTAEVIEVDRFSTEAGMLMVRTADNGLPEANEAVDFDQAPFITQGYGPGGEIVQYYNFDVQSTDAAPIYVLFKEGESTPVSGQLNIIDVIPGDEGYNDFWQVHKVTVPSDYEANTASSLAELNGRGFTIEALDMLVNCPVVPDGSTASKRLDNAGSALVSGWYKGKLVKYFEFNEKALSNSSGIVPLSPIYVTFNINPDPDNAESGPQSGFVTELNSSQTHNVLATVPSDNAYSPLWNVNIYDNADFDNVSDLLSATGVNILVNGAATVNCPVVSVE